MSVNGGADEDAGLSCFPLGEVSLAHVIQRSREAPPPPPMQLMRDVTPVTSPVTSYASADSLDSLLALDVQKTPEQVEVDNLIYRLCQSLYNVASKKSVQIHRSAPGAPRNGVDNGDAEGVRFRNMRGHEDWCPLRHLFDPASYYTAMGRSNPHVGCTCLSGPDGAAGKGTPTGPAEVSQWMACELSVTRLAGGNSNHVYRLEHASFPGKSILLRVYGTPCEDVIDRVRDVMATRHMSKAGLCPAVLHSFRWGRVEEFMDGVYTCTTEMLLDSPALLGDVYEGLCRMHALDAAPFLPERADAGREMAQHAYYATLGEAKALESACPTSFERASLRLLRLMSPHVVPSARGALVDWVAGEVLRLRGELRRREVPVVLSHNDLNPGNILLARRCVPARFRDAGGAASSSDDEVTAEVSLESSALSTRYVTRKGRSKNAVERRGHLFIDFEYADANYRCYDLGNTLCELDYDYTRGTEPGGRGFIKYLFLFPPAEKAAAWRALPEEYPRLPELIHDAWRRGDGGPGVGGAALTALRRYFAALNGAPLGAVALREAEVREVMLGMLASHLHWTLWAVVMGCSPDECAPDAMAFAVGSSGLDYIKYGECRLREYLALRQWLKDRGML